MEDYLTEPEELKYGKQKDQAGQQHQAFRARILSVWGKILIGHEEPPIIKMVALTIVFYPDLLKEHKYSRALLNKGVLHQVIVWCVFVG